MINQESTATVASPSSQYASETLAPISPVERIGAIDILRGFALLGIVLMNIEWFGRPIAELATFDDQIFGVDHAVGWLIRCFVEGKFYKLFALLFGMGFAVMLLRAREKGRPFIAWFVRRMGILFIFGMLHMIFIWGGDILHDYAFAGVLFLGLLCLLERERFSKLRAPKYLWRIAMVWLVFPFVLASIAGVIFGVMKDPIKFESYRAEERAFTSAVEDGLAVLQSKDRERGVVESYPQASEGNVLGEQSGQTYHASDKTATTATTANAHPEPGSVAPVDINRSDSAETLPETGDVDTVDGESAEAEQAFERRVAERVDELHEHQLKSDEEALAYGASTYWQATQFRARDALARLLFTVPMSLFFLLPMFLLGYWFVVSGVIKDHLKYTQLFTLMTYIGIGVGLPLTIAALLVLQHPITETMMVVFAVAMAMFQVGQYFMTAGYLGLVILALKSERYRRWLSALSPFGRMALTNYIMQSVVLAAIFHGYAGGLFGDVPRATQALVVLILVTCQIHFSGWWLARYRFGPLEWLWRCLSYQRLQAMRIES